MMIHGCLSTVYGCLELYIVLYMAVQAAVIYAVIWRVFPGAVQGCLYMLPRGCPGQCFQDAALGSLGQCFVKYAVLGTWEFRQKIVCTDSRVKVRKKFQGPKGYLNYFESWL